MVQEKENAKQLIRKKNLTKKNIVTQNAADDRKNLPKHLTNVLYLHNSLYNVTIYCI